MAARKYVDTKTSMGMPRLHMPYKTIEEAMDGVGRALERELDLHKYIHDCDREAAEEDHAEALEACQDDPACPTALAWLKSAEEGLAETAEYVPPNLICGVVKDTRYWFDKEDGGYKSGWMVGMITEAGQYRVCDRKRKADGILMVEPGNHFGHPQPDWKGAAA